MKELRKVPVGMHTTFQLPVGAEVLSVVCELGSIYVYVLGDVNAQLEYRGVTKLYLGEVIDPNLMLRHQFVGKVIDNGQEVFVFVEKA